MKPKLLYVELSDSHFDVMYSFIKILENDYEIEFLLSERIKPKLPQYCFKFSIQFVPFDRMTPFKSGKTVRFYIEKISPEYVLFNTAQGKSVLFATLMSPLTNLGGVKIKYLGIHHNAVKLLHSFSQKIINLKIKKYFVLSKLVAEHLKKNGVSEKTICSIYPVYFETEKLKDSHIENEMKYFAIPGEIDFKRRDYESLVSALGNYLKNSNEDLKNLQFLILGNANVSDGPKLKKIVSELDLSRYFVFFDHFICNDEMFSFIKKSIAILPLLHPNLDYFTDYTSYKISGNFNLAYGLKIPMLLHEAIQTLPEFQAFSIGYNELNLIDTLIQTIQNPKRIEQKKQAIINEKKFDIDVQKKMALSFINNSL